MAHKPPAKSSAVSPTTPSPAAKKTDGWTSVKIALSQAEDVRDLLAVRPDLAEDLTHFVRAALDAAIDPHRTSINGLRALRKSSLR